MKTKYQKHYLIHKELRYYRLDSIMWQKYGMYNQDKFCNLYKGIKIKYFHVNLIMRVIPLLQDLKTIHVRYGEIYILMGKVGKNRQHLLPRRRLTSLKLRSAR